MKKLLLTLSLILSLGLSMSAVAAQTDGVEAPDFDDIDVEVEGLQSIYDRTFSVDIEEIMADPEFDFESFDISSMLRSVSIQGMTFDSDDAASAYLDEMQTELDAALEEDPEALDGAEVTELDGLGVDGLRVVMDMPDLEMAITLIVFVDGNHVFQVIVMDSSVEYTEPLADEVAQFIIDADVETEEVTFSEDGTSTGGVYDRMPTADDALVSELTDVMDSEIMVADE